MVQTGEGLWKRRRLKKIKMGGSAFPDTERLSEPEYQRIVSQVNHATATVVRLMWIFFEGFRVAEEK